MRIVLSNAAHAKRLSKRVSRRWLRGDDGRRMRGGQDARRGGFDEEHVVKESLGHRKHPAERDRGVSAKRVDVSEDAMM